MKKMIQTIAAVLVLGISMHGFAHGGEHGEISTAKAAELALHRIGKLVDLNKIDASFVAHIAAIQVQVLPDDDASGATYKAIAHQAAGADGARTKIDILLDEKGKALSHVVKTASVSQGVSWPDADPLTISENAFHYVLDHATDAAIKPYFDGFTEMTLAAGNGVALATFKSSQTTKVLVVTLNLAAVVTATEIR